MINKDASGLLGDGNLDKIESIKITAYEPAFGIIGDEAKRKPTTRQSADHSMVYIIARLIKKAFKNQEVILKDAQLDTLWKSLMVTPYDYDNQAIFDPTTRKIMEKI